MHYESKVDLKEPPLVVRESLIGKRIPKMDAKSRRAFAAGAG